MDLAVYLADTTSQYFLENMGHPLPIKIAIIKKCPNLLRIYGTASSTQLTRQLVTHPSSDTAANPSCWQLRVMDLMTICVHCYNIEKVLLWSGKRKEKQLVFKRDKL